VSSSRSIATLRPARVRSMRDARVTCARGSSIWTCERQKSNDENNDIDDDEEGRWKDVVLEAGRVATSAYTTSAYPARGKVQQKYGMHVRVNLATSRKRRCHRTGFSRELSVQSNDTFLPP